MIGVVKALSGSVLLLLLILLTGCHEGRRLVHVRGKVTYKDGSALKGGVRVVHFEPSHVAGEEGLRVASGQIESDGTYDLFTKRPGDGIMPGTYNVSFTVWKGPHEPVSYIADKFTAAASSPFKDVKVDSDRDDLNFELEPKSNAGAAAPAETPGQAHQ